MSVMDRPTRMYRTKGTRSETLLVRLSKEEKHLVRTAASLLEHNVSDYVREATLDQAVRIVNTVTRYDRNYRYEGHDEELLD